MSYSQYQEKQKNKVTGHIAQLEKVHEEIKKRYVLYERARLSQELFDSLGINRPQDHSFSDTVEYIGNRLAYSIEKYMKYYDIITDEIIEDDLDIDFPSHIDDIIYELKGGEKIEGILD